MLFETAVPTVAKWRWGAIVKALPAILELMRPLSLVWSAGKFLAASQTAAEGEAAGLEDGALDAAKITAAVESVKWKVYGEMLLCLHQIGNFMSAWGSGCRCHEWLSGLDNKHAESVSATLRSSSLPADSDGPKHTCLLAGKRAPELADGTWRACLQNLVERMRPEVLLAAAKLPKEELESVLNDFEHGVSYIQMVLDIKLAHWTELPWRLCALATDVVSDKPIVAKDILDSFSKLPQDESFHHRLTWRFLQPRSKLREQLQALADNGAELEDLPELFHEAAGLPIMIIRRSFFSLEA